MSRFALAVVAAALAVAFAALIGWAHARPGAVPPLFWAATLRPMNKVRHKTAHRSFLICSLLCEREASWEGRARIKKPNILK